MHIANLTLCVTIISLNACQCSRGEAQQAVLAPELAGSWECKQIQGLGGEGVIVNKFFKVGDHLLFDEMELASRESGLSVLWKSRVEGEKPSNRIVDLNPVSIFVSKNNQVDWLFFGPLNSGFRAISVARRGKSLIFTFVLSDNKVTIFWEPSTTSSANSSV